MNVKQLKDTYLSRNGLQLKITLADPEFVKNAELLLLCVNYSLLLADKLGGVLSIMSEVVKYDAGRNQEVYKPMRITSEKYDSNAGILFHSTPQKTDASIAGLGYILQKDGAVCREKAMYTHLILAGLGIRSVVVNGTVSRSDGTTAGHAWVDWVDPPLMRLPGPCVFDGTWGKAYADGYYYDKFVVSTINSDAYFEPSQGHKIDEELVYKAIKTITPKK